MTVRRSLLAILDQGPCYGYQLRTEFDRRTGERWPLNVGQIYNTLERLERDGLVTRGESDDRGHVFYRITPAGRSEVQNWLDTPATDLHGTRDELTIRIALALSLPGADAHGIVRAQIDASRDELARLTRSRDDEPAERTRLVTEALILHTEARLAWLDLLDQRVTHEGPAAFHQHLTTAPPRRGRPPRRAEAPMDASARSI